MMPDEDEDVCPYCDELCYNLFGDLDDKSDEDFSDWKVRVKHLEYKHNFDKCQSCRFYSLDHFLLHLAGSHNLYLSNWTKDVIDSCRREKHTLIEIINIAIKKDDLQIT